VYSNLIYQSWVLRQGKHLSHVSFINLAKLAWASTYVLTNSKMVVEWQLNSSFGNRPMGPEMLFICGYGCIKQIRGLD
jgi:hypothetical protein